MLSAAGFHVKINTQGIIINFFDCGIFSDVKKNYHFLLLLVSTILIKT